MEWFQTEARGFTMATPLVVESNTATPAVSGKSTFDDDTRAGTGVAGSATGRATGVSGLSATGIGVRGHSSYIAVHGTATGKGYGGYFASDSGPGVFAESQSSVAANFVARKVGQIRLAPEPATFFENPEGPPNANLPRFSQAGELRTVTDDDGVCTLWLCVQSLQEGGGPTNPADAGFPYAKWAQVLLGPSFPGSGI